ncbi:MAG: diguanylate cyclase domain-containing protein [Myxococcota bacterium]
MIPRPGLVVLSSMILWLLTLVWTPSAQAHNVVQIHDPASQYSIGFDGVVHPDPDGTWNAENLDALLAEYQRRARQGARDFADTPTERYWFVFTVQNHTAESDWVLSFHAPLLRHVTVFDFDEDGEYEMRVTGYDAPVESRLRPALDYAVPLRVDSNRPEVVAVLFEDPSGDLPGTGDIRLESDTRFRTQTFRMIAAAFLSLGAVLAVGIYVLLIWMRLHEPTYLWFGAFALSSFVLWGTHYELFRLMLGRAYDLNLLNFMANAASLLFCVLFVRSFLGVERWSAAWNKAAMGLVCGLIVLLGVTPLLADSLAYTVNASAALLTLIFVLGVGTMAVFRKVQLAGAFLVAWAVYFSTGALTIADALGMDLPTVSVRVYTVSAVAFGTLLMAWSVGNQVQELISQKHIAEVRARTDALTQLRNRASFDDQLEHFQHKYDAGLVSDLLVLFADLDGLKLINDTQGHDVGDNLLRDFARSLEDRFRNVDGIFRVGGDEFILLLPDAKPAFATWMPERIDDIIEELRELGYAEASVSIGIAMVSEANGDARKAVRLADERMYQEKGSSQSH